MYGAMVCAGSHIMGAGRVATHLHRFSTVPDFCPQRASQPK